MQIRADLDDGPNGRLEDEVLTEGAAIVQFLADTSVADAYVFVVLSWAPKLGIELVRWPRLNEFSRRVNARDAVKAAVVTEGLQKAA